MQVILLRPVDLSYSVYRRRDEEIVSNESALAWCLRKAESFRALNRARYMPHKLDISPFSENRSK